MPQIELIVTPLRSGLLAGHDTTATALIRVRAPAAAEDNARNRSPLNLAIVIDRSGSMQGRPLAEAKRCAEFVVHGLALSDTVVVVEDAFADDLVFFDTGSMTQLGTYDVPGNAIGSVAVSPNGAIATIPKTSSPYEMHIVDVATRDAGTRDVARRLTIQRQRDGAVRENPCSCHLHRLPPDHSGVTSHGSRVAPGEASCPSAMKRSSRAK